MPNFRADTGKGGDNHFRHEYFKELKTLSQENVFCLFMMSSNRYRDYRHNVGTSIFKPNSNFNKDADHCVKMEPDIISFGKKTQVCGIFAGDRLNEVDNHVFHESSRINSFWWKSCDMVRFTIYAEIIQKKT